MWRMTHAVHAPGGRLVIAVVTYRRPDRLSELLTLLPERLTEFDDGALSASVLVVDNDPQRSAEPVVESAAGLDVTYVVEPEPGVAAARSAALAAAGDAHLLVFVDDDEVPRPGWLPALVATWRDTGADAVVGPVVSVFDVPPDAWATASGIHDRDHHRGLVTGQSMPRAATNNLLLDLPRVRALGVDFDPRFGLTGGEDSMFTGTLVARGGRIVWCAQAVVEDRVPAERMTRNYLIERTESLANASARAEVALLDSGRARWRQRARLAGVAATRWCWGAAQRIRGAIRSDLRSSARGAVQQARARGEARAAVGQGIAPYARPAQS